MSSMKYRPEIDGLRAISVLSVIFFHAGFGLFSGGYVGVDVFFVISGYLITTIIAAEIDSGKFSFLDFYERRIRRILPALLLVLIVSIGLSMWLLLPGDMKDFSQSLVASQFISSNIHFWLESGYFDTGVDNKPLMHTWSLAVEEQYYLLFPPALLLMWRWGEKNVTRVLLAVGLLSLIAAELLVRRHPDSTFFLLHTRAWELMIGSLAALFMRRGVTTQAGNATAQLLSLSGLALIVFSIFVYDKNTLFPSLYALAPTVGAALVIMYACPESIAGKLLALRPLVMIGLISYSGYLWHQPLFVFARKKFDLEPGSPYFYGLIIATLVLAFLSWKFVETPFRSRRAIPRKRVFSSVGALSLGLVAFGTLGIYTQGSVYRYDERAMEIVGFTEARGEYVWKRASALYLKDFEGGKTKVLIIGDSMAADFVNVLDETRMAKDIQLSFYTIDFPCGNLYVKEDLVPYVNPTHRQLCINRGWYENAQLKKLLQQADKVLLVSVWDTWQMPMLKKSLSNLREQFGDKFYVMGRKTFGDVDVKALGNLKLINRIDYRLPPNAYVKAINQQLESLTESSRYLDLNRILCRNDECKVFNEAGELLSYDGSHLTPAGAKYVSQELSKDPSLKNILLGEH